MVETSEKSQSIFSWLACKLVVLLISFFLIFHV